MGVGSVSEHLLPYEECDTFLSTDAGVTWMMVRMDAHKYEFGDSGSIVVILNDEEMTDEVRYSTDFGKTWCVLVSQSILSVWFANSRVSVVGTAIRSASR